MKDTLIPLAIIAVVALLFVGSFSPSCTFRPALINWERREKPLFPIRKKHAAPAEPSHGEGGPLPGAAPINPAPAATVQNQSPGCESPCGGGF